MLVWTCLEIKKKKEKKKSKCYFDVFKSKLASKHMPCLLLPLFFLSFFCFLCFGASIYSLTQWHEILYIVDVIEVFDMKVAFIKNWKHNLEASLSVFWSQNWILLDVSIYSYMVLMWFNWSIATINATLQLLNIYIYIYIIDIHS